MSTSSAATAILASARRLSAAMQDLHFGDPVAYCYNPLGYAWAGYESYVRRFVQGEIDVLYLGMNPGPFGMAQTGVPFGEISAVVDWMGIHELVGQPARMHPKRPIEGFSCTRSEVSGRRLWGLFAELYGTAEAFFAQSYVENFCPLIWMRESGANITPAQLTPEQRAQIDVACQLHLQEIIRILQPRALVGVGLYAGKQLALAQASLGDKDRIVATILHPSPASPMANKCWPEKPRKQLDDIFQLAGLTAAWN